MNSFEFPQIPKSGGSFFFHFDWFDWYGNFISINKTFKLQDQNICTRKEMKWNEKLELSRRFRVYDYPIFTLSSGLLSPPIPSFSVSSK
jgi:hypothetical protein